MTWQPARLMVLAPHTDDGEFGAGGSITRWIREGTEVSYVAFSSCEESLSPEWPRDTLVQEVTAATRLLGIASENLHVMDFPVRNFDAHRQKILEAILDLKADFRPDAVLTPSLSDLHQDHQVIAMEGLRAFKKATVLAYEVPWNNIQFPANLFVKLSEADALRKLSAIAEYRSQADRGYSRPDYLLAHLRYRGTQVDTDFAETFEVTRWTL